MTNQHTPGPWTLRVDHYEEDNQTVGYTDVVEAGCTIYNTQRSDRMANARLIAAAPEMLAALHAVMPLMIPGMDWTDEIGQLVKRMVNAAIAKAEGKQ